MATRTPEPARILIFSNNEESDDPLAFLLNIAGYEVLALKGDVRSVETAAAFQPTICLLAGDFDSENSQTLSLKLRRRLPNPGLVFAELGKPSHGQQLPLTGDENHFQIVERIQDYLHEHAVAV